MKTLSYLDYCALPRYQQFFYKIYEFILKVIFGIWHFIKGVGIGAKNLVFKIGRAFRNMFYSFKFGDVFTKCSFLLLGVSHFRRGQRIKGIILACVEVLFILFMVLFGGNAIYNFIFVGKFGNSYYCPSAPDIIYPEQGLAPCDFPTNVPPDNSPLNLLYGILTFIVIAFFITVYVSTVNASYKIQTEKEEGRHVNTFVEDAAQFLNSKFHVTLLFLPIIGIVLFNILPILDMICMAFTNYDYTTDYPSNYFSWVGLKNFAQLFNFGSLGFGYTFIEILKWTFVWAILATFINFFLGIIVATIINRKGIKFKKFWRTCLVLSVAVPQFVSLLAMSQFFNEYGPLTKIIEQMTGKHINFLGDAYTTFTIGGWDLRVDFPRILIVVINIWIGIPYTVLSTTGILMNVPEDLYESAKIDGASAVTMYFKITLRYIVFVMGPSLITTFIGNFNSFGVIFLLTGGGPKTNSFYGSAGHTDLLVTWLYQLTMGTNPDYKMASVIGILIFLISSLISLILYRNSSSFKNEEDFA